MECYACENEATRQCRRCARVYCEVHGGDLCAECLNPASALPSFNLYRGSLLALLVGTAVALWLIVRPPTSSDSSGGVVLPLTPTAVVTEVIATPTSDETPDITTPTPGATPRPTRTQEPEPTEEPEVREYVVQSGDTLLGIAELFAPAGVDPVTYAANIAAASGLSSVEESITTGQVLILP
ncbi:MAG: LysM peptidoglycan-binding domain-containing protein [Dehalococcoidia bacterium]